MLRISHEPAEDARVVLRLEGDVNGRWVEELERECDRALRAVPQNARVVLDLGGVSSIDGRGLALFRQLAPRGIVARNCSPYLVELLKDVACVEG